jgi:hypothetical protein
MAAGCINICGAFGGDMSGPNKNNEKGMFENQVIRNQIVKPYLRQIGADPLGQYPLPSETPIPENWRENILSVMESQGLVDGEDWMYKGAKMTIHWKVWNDAFPNAKWVIVRRKTPDIVRSCLRTGFMRAFAHSKVQRAIGVTTEADGWKWWVAQHEKQWQEMINAGLNVKEVWPERMVDGDYSQMKGLMKWLGLEWSEKVKDFIEPKLCKARKMKFKEGK